MISNTKPQCFAQKYEKRKYYICIDDMQLVLLSQSKGSPACEVDKAMVDGVDGSERQTDGHELISQLQVSI